MSSSFFRRLSLHPIFVFAVIMHLHCSILESAVSNLTGAAITALVQASPGLRVAEAEEVEAENIDIETAATRALVRHHTLVQLSANLQLTMSILTWAKSCCSDFNESGSTPEQRETFKAAGNLLRDNLVTIEDRLKIAEVQARSSQSLTQAYKQSLEIQNATINNKLNVMISSQSRDIARDSKRDSSAMKAIALLTMFFLPGTFVAAFFAMPLFNWEAGSTSSVLNSRFWIYWAVTVPATALTLVLWRMWFKFDHWRLEHSDVAGASIYRDYFMWLKSGQPGPRPRDVENGTKMGS